MEKNFLRQEVERLSKLNHELREQLAESEKWRLEYRSIICDVGTAIGLIMPERVNGFSAEGIPRIQSIKAEIYEECAWTLRASMSPGAALPMREDMANHWDFKAAKLRGKL